MLSTLENFLKLKRAYNTLSPSIRTRAANNLLQSVINAQYLNYQLKKKLYNNVSPRMNTQTDSSTLVMSDTSFLAKSLDQTNWQRFRKAKLFQITFSSSQIIQN